MTYSIEQNARTNLGKITVATGYNSIDSTIFLKLGDGAKIPDPLTNGTYDLIWWNSTDYLNPYDDPNVETVGCVAKAGDALIVLRKDGSSDKNMPGKTYSMAFTSVVSNVEIKGLSYYNVPQSHGASKHDSSTVDGGHALPSGEKTSGGGTVVGDTDTNTLTNKTITDTSNNVMAKSLKSATTTVDVSAAVAPSFGKVLTAQDSTHATWETPAIPPLPASTVVTEQAYNQASAVGTSTTAFAREDHTHGTISDTTRTILPIISKTANYPATNSDYTILGSASGGVITITLPIATGNTGKIFNIKKTDATANVVTIATGGGNIDGAATRDISTQYETITVQSDGTNYYII